MKYYIISILLLQCSLCVFGQENLKRENRKGALFFKTSLEYRIASIYSDGPRNPQASLIDINDQNTGAAINYALDWFVGKNLSLGFSHSLRYDHLLNQGLNTQQVGLVSSSEKNTLLMDFHFYLHYHIPVFKESELFVQFGRSLMHVGSSFTSARRFEGQNGELFAGLLSPSNANFGAWNFGVGWKKNRFEILGGIYTTGTSEYFVIGTDLSTPYLRLSYNIGRL